MENNKKNNKRTKTIRRIDMRKVEEIQKAINECREKGFDNLETTFFEHQAVPKATQHEHASANNSLYLTYDTKAKKWKIDADILRSYNREIRKYNKSVVNPDEKIIGVPDVYPDIEGNECKIFYRELAHGENITKAKQIEAVDARTKGDNKRKAELILIKNDKDTKKRHAAKFRLLQRRLNKGKREGN